VIGAGTPAKGPHELREIHLVSRPDGTTDLFVIGRNKYGQLHHHHRVFADGEEVGDLRQYTDGPDAEYLKWPNRVERAA